tara:strand:+ start:25016 stop:26725 length:1710 start_codon:yes stop_codon:yes gene_type:complete
VAFLRVVQGSHPGELHELLGERIVLGRHPSCEVVLDNAAISRQHARLIRQGTNFVIEDLGSRNGTHVNGKMVSGLQAVANRDRVRICDIVLEYLDEIPMIEATMADELSYNDPRGTHPGGQVTVDHVGDLDYLESSSSIISSLNAGTISRRLDVRPEVKLRALLELSSLFSRTVDVSTVMKKTLECLFRLFPQSEMGLVLLTNAQSKEPIVKAARNAKGEVSLDQKFSSTVFRQAIESHSAILSEDMGDDTRFRDSESASMLEIRSMMCSPLTGGEGSAFGAIQLTTKDLKKPFNQDDLDLFVSVACQAGLAIENAHMHAEIVHRREMERDLEVATQIQLGFLPNKKPSFLDFEFWHFYQAAQQVGGDYFDYVRLPDGRLAIAVGDVSGKGVPAALLMARLCSAVRYHLVAQKSVARALTELNRELLASSLGFRFITLVIVVLEPGSNTAVIVNAGHLPPVIHHEKNSEYMEGDYSGLPLGVGGDFEYQQTTLELTPGSSMLLYTDGITETEDSQHNLYGRERLLLARPKGSFTPEKLVNYVLNDTVEFCGGLPQRDDRCVVAFKYSPT